MVTEVVVDYKVKIQPVSEFTVCPAAIHEIKPSFYPGYPQKLIWLGNVSHVAELLPATHPFNKLSDYYWQNVAGPKQKKNTFE